MGIDLSQTLGQFSENKCIIGGFLGSSILSLSFMSLLPYFFGDDETKNPRYYTQRAKNIWRENGQLLDEATQDDLDWINLTEFAIQNETALRNFRKDLKEERFTRKRYIEMLRKIKNLTHRIGGMEMHEEEFARKRVENLYENLQTNNLNGELDRITAETIAVDPTPLNNYVKFYYENLNEMEEILDENLNKICYALDLKYEELRSEIDEINNVDLKAKEIERAKPPTWLKYD